MSTNACNQFEKQLHEALDNVKEQRERNTNYQKEIHDLKQQSIMKSWEIERGEIRFSAEEEHPIVKQITEEYKTLRPPTSGNFMVIPFIIIIIIIIYYYYYLPRIASSVLNALLSTMVL